MAEEGPDKMGGGCGNDGQCGNFLNIFWKIAQRGCGNDT